MARENSAERTLVFLKPDTFENKVVGKVIGEFEKKFRIITLKMMQLTKAQAEAFYIVHKGKPFYNDLTNYVTRGPIIAMVLEEESIITRVREFMGNTNPSDAAKETLRGKYGSSLDANVVHGSDSPESAAKEIPFFFSQLELERMHG